MSDWLKGKEDPMIGWLFALGGAGLFIYIALALWGQIAIHITQVLR
jgi:hypothetical protein